MAAGWIKVYRSIENNWIWNDDVFSRGQAWIDILLMVNHEDNKIMFNGTLTEIKRGDCITSIRKLSDKWGWSRNKVDHFLKQLKSDGMIDYKKDTKKTLLTVENYDLYQSRDLEKGHQKATEKPLKDNKKTTKGHQKDTNKNDKEYIKNDKEGKEGKEESKATQLSSLSFPTDIYKEIFDLIGEIGYRTWFMDSNILLKGEVIEITVIDALRKNVIENNYSEKINTCLHKKVIVKVGDMENESTKDYR